MTSIASGAGVPPVTTQPSTPPQPNTQLKRELRQAMFRKRTAALALIAPLAIFLLLTFLVPIAMLLKRAVENPEIATTLPHTVAALTNWDRKSAPPDAAYAGLASDLLQAKEDSSAGSLARRLNSEISGARSIIMKTARALPLLDADGKPLPATQIKQALIDIDEQWGQLPYWQVIAKNGAPYSPYYLLAALDLKQDA